MTSSIITSEQSLQEILSNILEIIDYKNDRNAFIQNFTRLCLQETLLNYLESLPANEQKRFKTELKDKEIIDALSNIKKFIDPELYRKIYLDSSIKMIKEYLASIYPVLTIGQKDKLKEYFAFLRSQHQVSI